MYMFLYIVPRQWEEHGDSSTSFGDTQCDEFVHARGGEREASLANVNVAVARWMSANLDA